MHISYVKEIKENRIGRIGVILVFIILIIALIAPLISSYSPLASSNNTLETPSFDHLLGTNDIGQDIWTRVIYGARNSLLIASSVGLLTVFLSVVIGASAALIGGIYERFILRLIDILLIIPSIIIIILIASFIRPNLIILIILLSILCWQGSARIFWAETLILKQKSHILAAKTFGASNFYILFKHIVPDLWPIMVSSFINHARRAVFMEAGLAFLGIADPLMVSWGTILNRALNFSYLNVWYWLIPPGLFLSLTVIGFSFWGHALEEILNPRLREGR